MPSTLTFPAMCKLSLVLSLVLRLAVRLACGVSMGLTLYGCDSLLGSSIKDKPLLSIEDFRRAQGHKLLYNIYLPSSWTGWVHQENSLFHYFPETQSYRMESIYVGQNEVDTLGSRFKISSLEWRYQFGFGHHGISLNESTFGLSKEGVVVSLIYSSEGLSDMRVEYSQEDYADMKGKILSFELKVLDTTANPKALLLVQVKEPSHLK